jgi:hypothetical protein
MLQHFAVPDIKKYGDIGFKFIQGMKYTNIKNTASMFLFARVLLQCTYAHI